MSEFYAMKLKEANKTTQSLRKDINQSCLDDLRKKKELKDKIFQLSLENQSLKSKIDLLNMRLKMYNAPPMFHSQAIQLGASSYRAGQVPNQLGPILVASTSNTCHHANHTTYKSHSKHSLGGL
ncbi:hypothetical protein VP01_682g6 [Puccinia sorghi]|uniref:Uncharacterized protein n=1 Tax=Puccinia sorghi TaxID=27349 RepID=A0A0L6UEJ1_9BASI|nr:hypothetical protein VP01_682g6 [Puccinia sorghi]